MSFLFTEPLDFNIPSCKFPCKPMAPVLMLAGLLTYQRSGEMVRTANEDQTKFSTLPE